MEELAEILGVVCIVFFALNFLILTARKPRGMRSVVKNAHADFRKRNSRW